MLALPRGVQPASRCDFRAKLREFGPFEDPVAKKWVAFAVAYWQRKAQCRGNQEEQIPFAAGISAQLCHYSPGDPVCGNTRLHQGYRHQECEG